MNDTRSSAGAHVWRFAAIGTAWEVETAEPVPADARAAIAAEIEAFDRTWSRFRSDSAVTALAASGGRMPLPAGDVRLLEVLAAAGEATGGAVHPLVGDALVALGYDAEYSFRPRGHPGGDLEAVASTRLRWDADTLTLDGAGTIDVGAAGKGLLVDRVLALIPASCGDAVVDGSGDLAVRGTAIRVGLEHPYDPTRAIGVWEVGDAALCASAANRRSWGDGLHHVLDARTGLPVRTVVATWARAADALHADAAATALFFDGGPAFAAAADIAWVRMLSDGRVEYSPGADAELFRRD